MSDAQGPVEEPEAFRLRARAWLAENMPLRPVDQGHVRNFERCRELQRMLYDGGFAGVCFPAE